MSRARTGPFLLGCCLLATLGCQNPLGGAGPAGQPRDDLRDDIVSIVQFWQQFPWIRHDERILGFFVTIYFVSAETEKGVFVREPILIWLYDTALDERGRRRRGELLQTWTFDRRQADGFRVRKRAIGGDHYGFIVRWDESLDLAGKQVEIQFGYQRGSDQRLVLGTPRRFQVR